MNQFASNAMAAEMAQRPAVVAQTHGQSVTRADAVAHAQRALIQVRNLRLRTFIGFNAEEKAKRQDVVINIGISYALTPGVFDDHVVDALDYKLITKKVIELVEGGRFLLLEKLVADVLAICSAAPEVTHATVSVDKPHALRFADSVSLTLEYHAGDAGSSKENAR